MDNIHGWDMDEAIEGGKGDDFLEGWFGSDTYVWKKGDGNDHISDLSGISDVDTLYPDVDYPPLGAGAAAVLVGPTPNTTMFFGMTRLAARRTARARGSMQSTSLLST